MKLVPSTLQHGINRAETMPSNDGRYGMSVPKPREVHTLIKPVVFRERIDYEDLKDLKPIERPKTWQSSYKPDPPKEVIVIEDSPENPAKTRAAPESTSVGGNVGVQTRKRKRDELDKAAAAAGLAGGPDNQGPDTSRTTSNRTTSGRQDSPCVERKKRRTRQSQGGLEPTPPSTSKSTSKSASKPTSKPTSRSTSTSKDSDSARIVKQAPTPPQYPKYRSPKLPPKKVSNVQIRKVHVVSFFFFFAPLQSDQYGSKLTDS